MRKQLVQWVVSFEVHGVPIMVTCCTLAKLRTLTEALAKNECDFSVAVETMDL